MSINNLSVVDISLKCGVLFKINGLSARMDENRIGRDEFLEPEALIVPFKIFPP
jgi:hypothetical protein